MINSLTSNSLSYFVRCLLLASLASFSFIDNEANAKTSDRYKDKSNWKWSNPLPSHKELMALPLEKRRQYLRSLSRIIRDMSNGSDFFSGEMINVSPRNSASTGMGLLQLFSQIVCIDPAFAEEEEETEPLTIEVTGAQSPETYCRNQEPDAIDPEKAVRCMVAGWLPKGPKCEPTWIANVKFDGDNKRLRCGRSAPILCNPIVFGVKEDGKALCVKGGGAITKKCGDLSAELNNTEQIGKVIEENPELWEEFKGRFNSGCKHGAISCNYYLNNRSARQSKHFTAKEDVFKTCFQAWDHLTRISQTAGLEHPDYGMEMSDVEAQERWGEEPVRIEQ